MKKSRAKLILKYVLPTVLSQCTFFLFTIIDGIFVGRGVGTDALGAVNLAQPLVMVIGAVFMLTTIGGVTITAIRMGRKDYEGANQSFLHATAATLVVAVFFTLVGTVFTKPLAILLGASGVYVEMVCDYLFWYAKLRKQKNKATGKPLSEATVEGVHSCLCGILSDAMEGGYLDHNPAWRTYKYAGQKKEKKIADDETVKQLIQALETVSILYETYFKLIIATGMRRGECCALKWEDINYAERSIHVCRNAVKTTGDEIIVKAPKTKAGNRYVYFSAEMESLLREYEAFCTAETERYDRCEQAKDDYVFRRKGMELPMTPSTFTWRFKKILKANDLPTDLNVHSLRHTAASLFIASGTDVGTVAGLLGHSQPSTTLDIYTHAFDKNKKAASQIMQSSLEIKLSPKKLCPVALRCKSR